MFEPFKTHHYSHNHNSRNTHHIHNNNNTTQQLYFNLSTYCQLNAVYTENYTETQQIVTEINQYRLSFGFLPVTAKQLKIDSLLQQQYNHNHTTISSSLSTVFPRYNNVVIGGTFDHLHSGHKILLTVAILTCTQKLVIGLTVDSMLVNKKYREELQSWSLRRDLLIQYIKLISPTIEIDIQPLYDMYGPSVSYTNLQAIVVSEETVKGGGMVNDRRREKGVNELEIIVVPLAK